MELCGCRMAGRVGSDPRSRPELPDNTKGRPRGWQKAQRGRCRRQEAEPTAEVQTSPEEQQVPEEGWGRPSSSALPGLGLCTPRLCFSDRTPTELTLRGNV